VSRVSVRRRFIEQVDSGDPVENAATFGTRSRGPEDAVLQRLGASWADNAAQGR
jgi:hypothetical protein